MRNTKMMIACLATLVLVLVVQSAVAQTGKLQGVWKIVEVTVSGPNPIKFTNPQPNLSIITKKYCSTMSIQGDKPRPDLPQKNATDAQKVATWTPFDAGAGPCEVKGSTLTVHPIIAKDPFPPGTFVTYEFKFEGKDLFITPKATQAGPIPTPVKLKCTRLE